MSERVCGACGSTCCTGADYAGWLSDMRSPDICFQTFLLCTLSHIRDSLDDLGLCVNHDTESWKIETEEETLATEERKTERAKEPA